MSTNAATENPSGVSFPTLTAMVVGSMVGAGVFSLPRRFAQETGVAGALIAWAIAGTGMLMLAFVFQRLAIRRPDLDAGVYAYAKAGFGDQVGFYSAAGYWASACIGNVTYWVLIMSTLGAWIPALGAGDTILAVAISTVGLWAFFYMIKQGIQSATAINRIVTIAKLVPIIVFILLALFVLDPKVFAGNFWGADYAGSLFNQVKNTMLVTVFVFLGIEGASVYSRYARKREDVGRATVLGFLSVLAIFASVSIVSYGVLPMDQIAQLRQPSMAGVLEAAVGPWGSVFVSFGLIISVLGAYLAWSLMAAEVLFVAAKAQDMPRFLARTSDKDVPVNALALSTALSQVFLIITLLSDDAFDFALDMTATLSLIPFFLAAAYALKLRLRKETYAGDRPSTLLADFVIAGLATIYTLFLLVAAGTSFFLISMIFYAVSTILFVVTRREQRKQAFRAGELALFACVTIAGIAGVVGLAQGWIVL